jgi:hypothetical protein
LSTNFNMRALRGEDWNRTNDYHKVIAEINLKQLMF